jgi:hypothetical protein
MKLVHLSDLHYASNKPFQIALTDALLKDLDQSVAGGFTPDFIVFSGDIVHNPDEPGIYEAFDTNFLMPVLKFANLTTQEVVFCPGNHDVSHKTVGEWSSQREQLKAAMARDNDELAKLLKTGPFQSYLKAISIGFFTLANRCGSAWANSLTHVSSFPNHKVSFVALNTGFGCGLEGSAYDRGKLTIPAEEVLAAFQSVPKDHRVCSLMHHTPSDLNESASRLLVPMIEEKASLHFFGHVHDPRPTVHTSPGTSCFMLQGGALYEDTHIYNGYSLVDTGPESDRVAAQYRTYYFGGRNAFDVGTNVAPNGTFYSSDASKSYWTSLIPIASNDDICLWLMETASSVIAELDKTITGCSLLETFVEPMLTRASNAEDNSTQRVTTTQILEIKTNIVLACDEEYGATALLSYLAMKFHQEPLSFAAACVPVLIDSRHIRKSYSAAVASIIRGALPESDDPRFSLRPLHDDGRLVILIDNIDPGNINHVNFLTTVRKDYPKARLIAAVKMPFVDTQRLKPVIGIDTFDFFQLRALTRGKVRALVEKWNLPAQYQIDTVVEEIHSRFLALGIPQTAPYVAIYLAVLQDIQGYNPINSSTVIEQFIESALQKYKPAYAFRSSFDYRNQIDYLAAMAERMCKLNAFTIDYDELYRWTREYFDSIGIEHDCQKLISHFIENKMFALAGNSIYFKYNIFLYFFTAHRMQQSVDFKQWVLGNHRYTNYITEIDIYCGLSRQDESIIEVFADEFSRLAEKLESYVRPLAWTDRLEKLTIPAVKKDDIKAFTDGITRQLTSNMPPEKRDEAVPGHDASPDVRPDLKRPEVIGLLPLWIMTLRAYTVSLKNLENIPKAKKEWHLQKILEGWSTVMLYACIVFKEITERRSLQIGSMKFVFDLPDNLDAR